jgi:hypothetical protein
VPSSGDSCETSRVTSPARTAAATPAAQDAVAAPAAEVVYEVECSLDPAIVADFDAWLPGHVREVLASPGFLDAETMRPAEAASDGRVRRVNRYRVRDRAALDHYLEQLAPAIRQDGIARFGDRATYTRRTYSHAAYRPAAETCANCDEPLFGHYCYECGQHAHESARSLGTLFHDAWHVLTHVDGRFWQTLRRLAFSPGFLTNEYFAERRARYIPPFRLYLILSLVFFGLTSVSSVFDDDPIRIDTGSKTATKAELEKDAAEIAQAKAELAKKGTVPSAVASVALAKAEEEVQRKLDAATANETAAGSAVAGGATPATAARDDGGAPAPTAAKAPASTAAKAPAPTKSDAAGDAHEPAESKRNGMFFDAEQCTHMTMEPSWLERAIGPAMKASCLRASRDGGKSLMHAIGKNIPKMMFVFLPLIAAVMLLLYWFPRRYYVEHLVFFLHVHAGLYLLFATLLLLGIVASVVPGIGWLTGVGGLVAFFFVPWYVWRAMRVHYRNGRLLTFAKACVIFVAYVTCLSLTLLGTAVLTAIET